eukprot:SAG31_NODE_6723_length_1910_cov_1.186085_2_plen_166_part_00
MVDVLLTFVCFASIKTSISSRGRSADLTRAGGTYPRYRDFVLHPMVRCHLMGAVVHQSELRQCCDLTADSCHQAWGDPPRCCGRARLLRQAPNQQVARGRDSRQLPDSRQPRQPTASTASTARTARTARTAAVAVGHSLASDVLVRSKLFLANSFYSIDAAQSCW